MATPEGSTAPDQGVTSQEEELCKLVEWPRSVICAEKGGTFGIAVLEKDLGHPKLSVGALSQLCTRVAEPTIGGLGRGKSTSTFKAVKDLVAARYPLPRVATRRLEAADGTVEGVWTYELSHLPPSEPVGTCPAGTTDFTLKYDAFNKRKVSGGEEWLYLYTADDERVWHFKIGAAPRFDRWTLRDLSGKVLREYPAEGYSSTVAEDYVYRGSQLLAAQ